MSKRIFGQTSTFPFISTTFPFQPLSSNTYFRRYIRKSQEPRSYCKVIQNRDTQQEAIRKVTVAGITGAIGLDVVKAVTQAGFQVQALTRQRARSSPEAVPATLIETDYTSPIALQQILTGQDAVISCLGDTPAAVAAQRILIEASISAGVKRFIPSEFGSDTTHPYVQSLPFFKSKLEHQTLLQEATVRHPHFAYTVLITGPFLDWGLSIVPFILNIGSQEAEIIDTGNTPFSVTTTSAVARAVVAILLKPAATANRALYIHEAILTQNLLVARASELTGKPFSLTHVDSKTAEKALHAAYAQGAQADPLDWIVPSINLSFWAARAPSLFQRTDNRLLGVEEVGGLEIVELVDRELAKAVETLGASDVRQGGVATEGNGVESVAEKAFESGKRRLVGFGQA